LHRHKIEEFPLGHWQAVIDVNLTSTFLCCRAVVREMKNQKSGEIVNISSDMVSVAMRAAQHTPPPRQALWDSQKH